MSSVPADVQQRIADNWQHVRHDVSEACRKADRDPAEVTIVGVTKYVDASMTMALAEAGCLDLGENRPQSLWEKSDALKSVPVRWHMIGNLQRNKARRTIPLLHQLHSIDSVRLAKTVNDCSAEHDIVTNCLLEVNVSGDSEKHGFASDSVEAAISDILELPHLRVQGLMCMASLERIGDEAAIDFRALRELRDGLRDLTGLSLTELSMGMSGDFEAAICEGATIVRIGSRLFAGLR